MYHVSGGIIRRGRVRGARTKDRRYKSTGCCLADLVGLNSVWEKGMPRMRKSLCMAACRERHLQYIIEISTQSKRRKSVISHYTSSEPRSLTTQETKTIAAY